MKINTSLMQLGRCLEALKTNQSRPKHAPLPVPFRESQLTRLFQDYLTGYGRTVMLANVSAQAADFDETAHALKYAHPLINQRTTFAIGFSPVFVLLVSLFSLLPPGTPSLRTTSSRFQSCQVKDRNSPTACNRKPKRKRCAKTSRKRPSS